MNSVRLYIVSIVIKIIPETRAFGLKRRLYRWAGVCIGKNVRICSSVHIIGSGELEIGDNTWIGHKTLIVASSKITIGNNVDIAPNVYIGTGTHEITPSKDRIASVEISKNIIIGDGCWLCANCLILPGIKLGKKCVIAAGAVVTKSFNDMHLIAGVPAESKKEFLEKSVL